MHFSIPDTQEFLDNTGTAYVGYNIHINGLLHCTVRYKQLHSLHEQLSKDPDTSLPAFPPKKFFPLTGNQQEERRLALEKYIQAIGQNAFMNKSELLNGFLLNAQIETASHSLAAEDLEVFLMNGRKIVLNVTTGDHAGVILQNSLKIEFATFCQQKICKQLQLPDEYIPYFTLFIMAQEENGDVNVYRKLQDFESPILTVRNIQRSGMRVVVGKWFWDIEFDLKMMADDSALHLLYSQAVGEIERGWILVSDETRDRLDILRDNGDEREYFEIARGSKYYGYIHFMDCFCDYPEPQSRVRVAIGRNEFNLRISTVENQVREVVFRVTHMRCWRITTVHSGSDEKGESTDSSFELSFEYLAAKNQLIWITIASDQAILMSVCIQSMIDELLLKKVSGVRNQEPTGKSWTYIMRDGHSRVLIGPSSSGNSVEPKKNEDVTQDPKSEPIIKKLTDRFSAMNRRKSIKSNSFSDDGNPVDYDARENRAFRVIGDDDL